MSVAKDILCVENGLLKGRKVFICNTANISMVILPGENSLQSVIVEILTKTWPASAKEIYNTAKTQHSITQSYKAVYKVLQEFVAKGVLEKDGQNYKISKKWISQLQDFMQEMKETYSKNPVKSKAISANVEFLSFGSIAERDKWIFQWIEQRIKAITSDDLLFFYRVSEYWPVLYHEDVMTKFVDLFLPKFKKDHGFAMYKSKGLIEQWCKKLYEKYGGRAKIGIDLKCDDFFVIGDEAVQAYSLPKGYSKVLQILKAVRDIKAMDSRKLYKIMTAKQKVFLLRIRDPLVIDALSKKMLSYF